MLEKMYEKLFNAAPAPLIVTDQKGIIKLANEQANALLTNKSLPLEGLSFCDFIDHSYLEGYFAEKACLSFDDFIAAYQLQRDHWIKGKEGTTVYAAIKAVPFGLEDAQLYIWTFDPIEFTRKLTYELKERVKEQLSILNVIELCFQSQSIPETLALCLQPIREGWQFPELTEVRITLASGEVFATDQFKKTEWSLQEAIISANERYGCLEVSYRHEVPAYSGKVFLYEEERLIKVLAKLLGTFLEHWFSSKRINKAVLEAQEQERYQISMELHDNVQQLLTVASINVEFLETTDLDATPKEALRILKRSLAEATQELRRLSQQLAPSIDPAFPLIDKINALTKSMSVHGRLNIKTDVDPGVVLNEKIQLGFYRIIQEQVTNIIKHARTSEVEISIKTDGKNITLRIIDKGIGFDMGLQKKGIGFENIKRRAESMNGTLDIVSSPGRGTSVSVQVPMV